MKNYRAINAHLVGGQSVQRRIGNAALIAGGAIAVIAGIDQIAPIGEISNFANGLKVGLWPALGLSGAYFGVKTILERPAARISRFVKAVQRDMGEGFHATLSVLGGLERQEDQDLLFGEISNYVGPEIKDEIVKAEVNRNSQTSTLLAEIRRLDARAKEVHAEITTAEAALGKSKRDGEAEISRLARQIEADGVSLKTLQEQVRTITADIKSLDERRLTAQAAHQAASREYEDAKKLLDEKLATKQAEFDAAVRDLPERFKGIKAQKEQEIEGLKLEVSRLTGQKAQMEGQFEKFRSEGQAKLDDLAAKKDDLEKDVLPGLEKEVDHLTKTKEDLIQDVTKLGSQIEDLRTTRQALIKQNVGIKSETKEDKKLAKQKKREGGEKV